MRNEGGGFNSRELRKEKYWGRIHLIPLLQAETDRDYVRRMEHYNEKEAHFAKSTGIVAGDLKAPVPGVGKGGVYDEHAAEPVYHTKRFVRPTYILLDAEKDVIAPQWWRGSKMFSKNPPYHERSDFTKEHPIGQ